MWRTKILSPAKINLHLDVAGGGSDGFHPLQSLFVMVSLYDEILIEETEKGCTIESNFDLPVKENILYKTWQLCQKNKLYEGGLKITLNKKIPSGAGLGGGSGNAASLLRVLYGKSHSNKPYTVWKELALQLGSDVPFFMESTSALVTGRGEQVKTVPSRTDYQILIVFPGFNMNTAKAFNSLDRFREREVIHTWGLSCTEIEETYVNNDPIKWPYFNSFSPSAYKDYPQLKKIEDNLLTKGADFVSLSGSGSAMVGIFNSERAVLKAKRALMNDFPSTYAVTPLDIMPVSIVI